MASSLSLYKISPLIFAYFLSLKHILNILQHQHCNWQHHLTTYKQASLCVCCRVAVVVSSANMELELVRQCVDRALVLDDRVSKFSVQLGEWPGDMAKLLDFLSREDVRSAAIRFGIFCPLSTHVGRCPICFSVKHPSVAPLTHCSLWVFLPGCWMSAIGHKATGQTFSRQR